MVAPRATGKFSNSMSNPTLLARASRGRSAPSPSLKSIIAWIEKFFVSQRDSAMRATNFKCFRFSAPPRRPVTKRSSPDLPPRRDAARSFSTNPITLTEIAIGPDVLLVSPPTMLTLKRFAALAQSAIKSSHPRDFGLLGNNKRNQRELGHS